MDQTQIEDPKDPPAEPVDVPNPEPTPAEPPKEDTNAILKDIRDRLDKPQPTGSPAPSREEIRARIKDQTGYTDAQLDFAEQMTAGAVDAAVAPLKEKVAWTELREEVGKIDSSIESEMKKELEQYPRSLRGDKVLLEKVYFMTVGRMQHKGQANRSPNPVPAAPPSKREDIVDRRIISNNPGSSPSLSGGGQKPSEKISDEERRIMAKFGFKSDEEYLAHKNSQNIESFKKK